MYRNRLERNRLIKVDDMTRLDNEKYSIYSLLIAFFLLLVPGSTIIEAYIPVMSYSDEGVGFLCIFIIIFLAIRNRLSKEDIHILASLIAMVLIGLVSNYNSKLIQNKLAIGVDAFWLCKNFLVLIAFKNLTTERRKKEVIRLLLPIVRILTIAAFFFGLLNLGFDIGMSVGVRYGIRDYRFIFQNPGRLGLSMGAFIAIIQASNMRQIKKTGYTALALFVMALTTKGLIFIIIGIYLILPYIWKKDNKITFKMTVPVSIAGLIMCGNQISVYLFDPNGPRVRLLRYGFRTAMTYFPLGSGFATYGSDMAYRFYSLLYIQYGFDEIWGLSKKYNYFLNDNYIGMIVAQMGWIGLILFLWVFINVFIEINNALVASREKAICLSIFVALASSTIGSAIMKSSIGVFDFMIFGLIIGNSKKSTKSNEMLCD